MDVEKHEARLTSAVLAKVYLHPGKNGKPNLKLHLAVIRRSNDPLRAAPDRVTRWFSGQGLRGETHGRKCYY